MKSSIYLFILLIVIGIIIYVRYEDKGRIEYTLNDGRSTDDINQIQGEAKFKMVRLGAISDKAKNLHEEGRKFGSQGKYDLAIGSFNKALEIEPKWAYPSYDKAYTLLLQGKQGEALSEYKKVDILEPDGFFTTKTAIWSLENEATNKFPQGTYIRFLMLEDIRDKKKRGEMAERIWIEIPGLCYKDGKRERRIGFY